MLSILWLKCKYFHCVFNWLPGAAESHTCGLSGPICRLSSPWFQDHLTGITGKKKIRKNQKIYTHLVTPWRAFILVMAIFLQFWELGKEIKPCIGSLLRAVIMLGSISELLYLNLLPSCPSIHVLKSPSLCLIYPDFLFQ